MKTSPTKALIKVKPAGNKDLGVFAVRTIPKNKTIETAHIIVLSPQDHKVVKRTDLLRFIFDAGYGRAAIALGTTSLYNHSDDPNASCQVNSRLRKIKITVTRTILAGEEITIDYGYHP